MKLYPPSLISEGHSSPWPDVLKLKWRQQNLSLKVVTKINKVPYVKVSITEVDHGWHTGNTSLPPFLLLSFLSTESSLLFTVATESLIIVVIQQGLLVMCEYVCIRTGKCQLATFIHKELTWPGAVVGVENIVPQYASLSLCFIGSLEHLSKWSPSVGSPDTDVLSFPAPLTI